ncbi:MAG: NAD(P)H-dependent oxidoreductase subunit E [Gammaproteobacteria bacterium]|nr:MAG: NAD(P)H-dependent oxidoreductase subunit E [Gammaproteobacteria bacterium]
MTEKKASLLSPAICEHIDRWILRYPPEQKQSGVFEALRVVQDAHQGSLTVELMDAVADYLGMPNIAVYEVATFYSLYFLQPVGKHIINLCTNLPCRLRGSEAALEHFKQRLGIDVNETTPDGQFTLKEVECLGACISAPVCQMGKKYYDNLTPEKIDEVLNGK